jgi:hypothetical protein
LTEAEVVTQSGDTGAEEEVGRERGEERREKSEGAMAEAR